MTPKTASPQAPPNQDGYRRAVATLFQSVDDGAEVGEGWHAALSAVLGEIAVAGDVTTLRAAVRELRRLRGRLLRERPAVADRLNGVLDLAVELERHLSNAEDVALQPDTHRTRLLRAIVAKPGLSSGELAAALSIHITEVSRTCTALLSEGLAVRRVVGKKHFWEPTPRGRRAMSRLEAQDKAASVDVELPPEARDDAKAAGTAVLTAVREHVEPLVEQATSELPDGPRRDLLDDLDPADLRGFGVLFVLGHGAARTQAFKSYLDIHDGRLHCDYVEREPFGVTVLNYHQLLLGSIVSAEPTHGEPCLPAVFPSQSVFVRGERGKWQVEYKGRATYSTKREATRVAEEVVHQSGARLVERPTKSKAKFDPKGRGPLPVKRTHGGAAKQRAAPAHGG